MYSLLYVIKGTITCSCVYKDPCFVLWSKLEDAILPPVVKGCYLYSYFGIKSLSIRGDFHGVEIMESSLF